MIVVVTMVMDLSVAAVQNIKMSLKEIVNIVAILITSVQNVAQKIILTDVVNVVGIFSALVVKQIIM